MARPSKTDSLSIAELEHILASHRARVMDLQRQRNRLQKKLDQLNRKISQLSGRRSLGRAARAKNATSLPSLMESILKSAGKPMKVGEILAKVLAAGYRSASANFRALVNQTLIKDKRFASAGRGLYQLKK